MRINELAANCAIYSSALDVTGAANILAAEGRPVEGCRNFRDFVAQFGHRVRSVGRFAT